MHIVVVTPYPGFPANVTYMQHAIVVVVKLVNGIDLPPLAHASTANPASLTAVEKSPARDNFPVSYMFLRAAAGSGFCMSHSVTGCHGIHSTPRALGWSSTSVVTTYWRMHTSMWWSQMWDTCRGKGWTSRSEGRRGERTTITIKYLLSQNFTSSSPEWYFSV